MHNEYGRTLDPTEFEGTFCKVLQDIDDTCHVLYDGLQKRMKEPWCRRPLKVCIVDNDDLNAFAYTDGTSDYVVVFRGAVECIYGTFLCLFSTRTFLPTIGDPSAEDADLELDRHRLSRMPLLRNDGIIQTGRFHLPNDPARQLAAFLISESAVEYLLYHEIGHIVGGHLDMTSACQCQQPRFRTSDEADARSAAIQILECDADAFAGHVTSWVSMAHHIDENLYKNLNSPQWTPQELEMLAYITSVGVLFRILDFSAPVEVETYSSDHPHPAVRCFFVVSCAFARAVVTEKLSQDRAIEILFATIRNIEEVWANLMLPGQRVHDPVSFAELVGAGMWHLFGRFQAHSAELSKYARLPRSWCDWEPLP
jgi:hypothetical protein